MSLQPDAPTLPPRAPARDPSLIGRAVAVFVRPAEAWGGLEEHHRWWFPALLVVLVQVAMLLLLYERAYLPTVYEQLDTQIASGAIDPSGAAAAQRLWESPLTGFMVAGMAGVMSVFMTLGLAFLVWVGAGFILGARFRYRLALEVTAWSGLVWVPQYLAFFVLAWSQETMQGIHFGLAAFLPEADPPSKLHNMLVVLLDAVGPFNIWFLVVAVLGCAALSGAPRRNLAWVLGGLAVALAVVSSLLTAWLSPGS